MIFSPQILVRNQPQGIAAPLIKTNLISYWNLDEASGTRADSHGANPLTDVNGVTSGTMTSDADTCAVFATASTQYLSHADNTDLKTNGTDFSISLWAELAGFSSLVMISKGGGFGQGEFNINKGFSGGHLIAGAIENTGGNTSVNSAVGITTGVKYHVVFTYVNSTKAMSLYVNNAAPTTATASFSTDGAAGTWRVGGSGGAVGWDGKIKQVGFWKRTLSAADVSYLYNGGNSRSYSEL